MNTVSLGWPLGLLLIGLSGLAGIVTWGAGLGHPSGPLLASLRAVVQLAAVSTIIVAVLHSMGWTLVFLGGMVLVAGATSGRRINGPGPRRPGIWWALTPIAAGVVPAAGLIMLSAVVPPEPAAVLPITGILIGGAMTATTLAARRMGEELTAHHGSYEAALSIGLGRRASVILVAREAAGLALVPGIDQTRTVGLVTLPGAFVGVLLAGASPWQAAAAQLLVLIALLLVQVIAVTVTIELVGAGRLPVTRQPLTA